jgi:hypothetical protein
MTKDLCQLMRIYVRKGETYAEFEENITENDNKFSDNFVYKIKKEDSSHKELFFRKIIS